MFLLRGALIVDVRLGQDCDEHGDDPVEVEKALDQPHAPQDHQSVRVQHHNQDTRHCRD